MGPALPRVESGDAFEARGRGPRRASERVRGRDAAAGGAPPTKAAGPAAAGPSRGRRRAGRPQISRLVAGAASRVQAKKGRERATRRAQAASVHVACAASCSLPFELPLCPLRGTPPALRVWSPLPSALLFWMPRSEKACLAAARKDLLGSEGSLNWSREIWILVKRLLGAASRKYSGSQMIPLVNSRRQRQSNLPSDVDNGQSRWAI